MIKTPRLLFTILTLLLIANIPYVNAKEKTLVFSSTPSSGFIRNFNLYMAQAKLETTLDFVFEPLFIIDGYNGGKLHYRLAEGIEFSEDLKFLTIKLRKGVRWSDGEAFDIDDLIFTLKFYKLNPDADTKGLMIDYIKSLEKIDSHTARLKLFKIDTLVRDEFADVFVIPEHQWSKIKNPMQFTNPVPIGTGPFTQVKRFASNGYTLCRNPHYWDQANLKVDCLKVPQLQENSLIIAAQRGELDWFGMSMADVEKVYVRKSPKNHGYWFPPQDTIAIVPNLATKDPVKREAFHSIHFRRAMSMAIDREAIIEFANPAATAISNPAGLGAIHKDWFNQDVHKQYGKYLKYHPLHARAELEKAGFKDINNDGFVETPSGKKLSFKIDVPTGWSDWINTVQIAIEGLNEVGINAKINVADLGDILQRSRTVGKANFDSFINFSIDGANPYPYLYNTFHSSFQDMCNNNTIQGWFAIGRYCNRDVDRALDAYRVTTDLSKRKAYINQLQEIIAHDMPSIILYSNPTWYQYNRKRFSGWWTEDNNKGNPAPHVGNRNRLLLLLDLKPKN